MREKKNIYKILAVIVLLCAAAAIFLVLFLRNRVSAENDFEEMQASVNRIEDTSSKEESQSLPSPEAVQTKEENKEESGSQESLVQEPEEDILEKLGIEVPEKNLDWEALQKQNKDIYAWIYVPDTTVDYPVLQHPTDNSYYLDYNLDGTKGFPGCIYTENYNSKDFTDVHTVIYGHYLADKTMFTSLHNFEKKELMEEDHYIFIYTAEKVFVYQIFAAYDYSNEHLLLNYNFSNEYVYEQYLKDIYKVKEKSKRVVNIRDDVTVTKEDRILTLSTCTRDSNPNYRFLVVGVLLNP